MSQSTKDKALQLLRYLRDFVKLRSTVVRDTEVYAKDGDVLWLGALPQDKDCSSPAWSAGEGDEAVWLRVRQQRLLPPPSVSEEVEPWVEKAQLTRTDPDHEPVLRSFIYVADDHETAPVEVSLIDHSEIVAAWDGYLPHWRAWRVERRRAESVQRVYARLFAIYQRQTKLGELYELVLSFGLLQWRRPTGNLRRHCFVTPAMLEFDRDLGEIRLTSTGSGPKLALEDEMMEADDRPPKRHYDVLRELLASWEQCLWDFERAESAFKEWSRSLHPDARHSMGLDAQGSAGEAPSLDFAPALVLRKRGVQPTVKIYDEMIRQLEPAGAIASFGLLRLVEPIDDTEAGEEAIQAEALDTPFPPLSSRVYFPKPANREQREIIARLRRHRGILVQGPPGTGKSHTIANLICHLLAEGKRVLVTSETPRALNVLKEKIPEPLRALCIANLGNDTVSFSELEKSVNEITRRQATYSSQSCQSAVTYAEARLDEAQRRLAVIDRRLRELRQREADEQRTTSGGMQGTLSALAEKVSADRVRFDWCELSDGSAETPPVSSDSLARAIVAFREIPADTAAALALDMPTSDVLPSRDTFVSAVAVIRRQRLTVEADENHTTHRAYLALRKQRVEWRARLRQSLLAVRQSRSELDRRPHPWRHQVLEHIISGNDGRWGRVRAETRALLSQVEPAVTDADVAVIDRPVDFTDERLFQDIAGALAAMGEGKSWPIFGLRFGAMGRYLHLKNTCRLNGIPVDAANVMERLSAILETRIKLGRGWILWAELEQPPASPTGAMVGHAALGNFCQTLDRAFEFAEHIREASAILLAVGAPLPHWRAEPLETWLDALDAADRSEALADAEQALERSAVVLGRMEGPRVHPVVKRLQEALSARDVSAWLEALEELESLLQLRAQLNERKETIQRLRQASSVLAQCIEATFAESVWDERARELPEAWTWAITDLWLKANLSGSEWGRLEIERVGRVQEWEAAMTELATAKAWQAFLGRLSPAQSADLKALNLAVKSLGKNTGQSVAAARRREDVRRLAGNVSEVLPAWIMPRHKVTESLEPHSERFDVVIVDEASQSGIDSLFLFHLGKKMIVVGDDQQISPAAGFVSAAQIAALQDLHLPDFPYRVALGVDSSLYDNARIRFGAAVMLREHFRCMPEIIQFSNDLCYAPKGTPLDPLRTINLARLEPVQTMFCEEGWREGGTSEAVNLAEAEALVEQVKTCVSDPRYAGKKMGVISLQGPTQALKIHQLLVAGIGASEMEARDLICGAAYDFQGDERDVIFLSMVAAPNERIGVLAKQSDQQRFNVATSRARDQLWLFHSAKLEDLSPACVRYRLLDYMLAPRRMGADVDTGKRFDSEFERRVHDLIVKRGFPVRTQVAVGDPVSHRYRIDLVVEGMQGCLAVECDGDRWHGPDRYEADMRRQRDLERAGWRFWRVRGGEFFRNPELAMSSLWEALEAHGVSSATTEKKPETAATPPQSDSAAPPVATAEEKESPRASSARQSLNRNSAKKTNAPVRSQSLPKRRNESSQRLDLERADDDALLDAFQSIIEAECPVLCSRVYALCAQAGGLTELSAKLKSRFNRCMYRAVREGRFVQTDDDAVGQLERTVRMPGTPAVVIRHDGKRRWQDVPRSELRSYAEQMLVANPRAPEQDVIRKVFEAYGGKRLDKQAAQDLTELLRPVLKQSLLGI
jgi:very-short-patch-repair endonuclease